MRCWKRARADADRVSEAEYSHTWRQSQRIYSYSDAVGAIRCQDGDRSFIQAFRFAYLPSGLGFVGLMDLSKLRFFTKRRSITLRHMSILFASTALLAMTGCASITGSKTQPVTVNTLQGNMVVEGAQCTLENDAGQWTVTTPGTVTVHKSTDDMQVKCATDDSSGHASMESKSNTAVWGNILAGGGIGYLVDRNTGAGFDYPDTITVVLRKIREAVGLGEKAGTAEALSEPPAPQLD